MAIVVNTNSASITAQQYLADNQSKLARTLTRLSSGRRVNDAKDDPAGLAISETMQRSILALKQGARNGNDGVSLVQTAQGAMGQSLNILQRMREIATQASTGSYSSSDLANLDTEYQSLLSEIDRIKGTATFNGISLLNGGTLSIQIGENNTANDSLTVTLTAAGASNLSINSTSVTSATNASSAMAALGTAIGTITTGLAKLGANQSNLESAVVSNQVRANSLEIAKGRIVDVDFAEESANMAKYTVLNQSSVAMLAQANQAPQLVLKLLQ